MSKGDQKTNKASNNPLASAKDSLQRDAKLKGKTKPKRVGATIENKAETGIPITKNELKTKRQRPKVETLSIQPNADNHKDENPIPEITNMEVHHHPQLQHKPKPFKEYLMEGFMIFIAVMMGFIAENIRESIDNNEHVQQLTAQLVHDLKVDTTALNKAYRGEVKMVRYNDTLFTLLQQPLQKADKKRIQKLLAGSHSMWLFHPSAGAMAAIKNELHLKQFSSSEMISYFSKYEGDIELLHTAQDVNLQYQRIYLDPFITQHFTPGNMVAAFGVSSIPNSQMRNLTQADFNQLAADMVLIRVVTNEMIEDNRQVMKDAMDLLRYVTKHYHLENE
jgi:hypothetical protein